MEQVMSCPYCGSNASLVSDAVVYGTDKYGMIYLCDNYPTCDAYVGVHEGTNLPKGSLANAELREWRKKAHTAFDRVWRGKISRKKGYKLMQNLMGMDEKQAHIGEFDVEQCKMLIRKLENYNQSKGDTA